MMKAKLLNIAAISALVLGAGAGTALASANGLSTGIFNNLRGQKPDIQISLGLGADLKAALEAGDYEAWVAALGDKEHVFSSIINEDNFDRYAEAWRLKQAGDYEAAAAIYEELGLKGGVGMVKGTMNMDVETRAKMEAAIENTDYAAWKELVGDKGAWAEKITADNFSRYAEAWRLDHDGDHEAAQAIYAELGLDNMGIRKFVGGHNWSMNAEARTELQTAIENRDYATWAELMGDMAPHLTAVVDATNFSRYAEAWELQQEGDFAGAQAIYEELGIETKMKGHMRWDMDDDGDRQAKAGLGIGANAGLKLGLMGGSRH